MKLICGHCKEEKYANDFSIARDRTRGRKSWCKACMSVANTTPERRKWRSIYGREYCKTDKYKQYIARYHATEKYKQIRKVAMARHIAKYPEKQKARILASNHLEAKTYCEDCHVSGVRLDMHHPDYTQPLLVVTLCRKCHGRRHRKYE